jgi:hypothetical protein
MGQYEEIMDGMAFPDTVDRFAGFFPKSISE